MTETQGYPGWQDAYAASHHINALAFMIRQMMAEASHVALVVVKAVTANPVEGAPPLVNVQPLVHQIDQTGAAEPHGIVYNIPTFRPQAGKSAFICDPKVGDIGAVICADRDISSALVNQAPANPGSFRRFDWADSLYIGGFAAVEPTTYVEVDDDTGVTIQVASGNPFTVNADAIKMVGSDGSSDTTVSVTGNLTTSGDVVADSVSVHDHVHSDSTSGPGRHGAPDLMSQTILLDTLRWDIVLDVDGNIAVASEPYALAQDVASACRTFLGEVYYDTTLGVPYLGGAFGRPVPAQFLGKEPSIAFVKAQLEAAAATVPGVSNPVAFVTRLSGRELGGQVQFTDPDGLLQTVSL